MTTRISNLLRRTFRTDKILERLYRIEHSVQPDQILKRLDRIEQSIQNGRLDRVEEATQSARLEPVEQLTQPALAPRGSGPFRAEHHTEDERTSCFQGNGLRISIRPQEVYPFTHFRIERQDGAIFDEPLFYSHLGLGKMLTDCKFDTVLEIGSRTAVAARAFEFTGKQVVTCEILDFYDSDFSGDYLDLKIVEPFDAIWCSHVLEHQRYLGQFLDKMYSDLRNGGVLAVTVPIALSALLQGHVNIFTPGVLLYNLICAGFDCSEAMVKTYDWQFSVIVRKKPNGIPRISFASERLGDVPNLNSYFPEPFRSGFDADGVTWGEVAAVNW